MKLLSLLPSFFQPFARRLLLRLPLAPPCPPLFILGCGRSGTTLLGQCLAAHPLVTYLNEPRQLWSSCFPKTDIWSPHPESRNARLILGAEDAAPDRQQTLARLFRIETLFSNRPFLVEKTPANNFRIPFLIALFPHACFLYLEREGLAVARSIARQNGWYGDGHDYKWHQLARLADSRPETVGLAAQCRTPYEKGLLEWRLSCQSARQNLLKTASARVRFLHYEILLARPIPVLDAIFEWLKIPSHPNPQRFAQQKIQRPPTGDIPAGPQSDFEAKLAGPLLDIHKREADHCLSNGIALMTTTLP